jgi:hypothetical protein
MNGKIQTALVALGIFLSTLFAHGQVRVINPSKTGPQQESIYRTLDFITANMDAPCGATLPMAKDMIIALEGESLSARTVGNLDMVLIGHGIFVDTTVAAFTGATKETVGYLVTVADNGGFFTANEQTEGLKMPTGSEIGMTMGGTKTTFLVIAGKYRGGTNEAKVEILLHELGHAVNATGFQADYGSPSKAAANDHIVMGGCKNVIKAAGKFKGVL